MSGHPRKGFLSAAARVLADAKEPLHYREITRRALEGRLVETQGLTPEATMNAQLSVHLSQHGAASPFVRVAPGIFGLREWGGETATAESSEDGRVFVPHFPVYEETRALLRAWDGLERAAITGMQSAIYAHRGSPQETADWGEPDLWIPDRLEGRDREVAERVWRGTKGIVNPRYTDGHWRLILAYRLLDEGTDGRMQLSERGRRFLAEPEGDVAREIDESQGLLKVLALVANLGRAKRADLLPQWGAFLAEESRIRAAAPTEKFLWARLRNLVRRGLLDRTANTYTITPAGLAYLREAGTSTASGEPDLPQQIRQLLDQQRRRVRESLQELLAEMDPYALEHLVKRLLDAMGYEDVQVTRPSNDKGVDVVGSIELGISSVREVIQVKRVRTNIQRPVLDALRGVLHRFQAVRGTIITTGNFSPGTRSAAFETGAAPITLIDGDKLIDLLIEHKLGLQKTPVELWELDAASLLSADEAEAEAEE